MTFSVINYFILFKIQMVEAAGVEPASNKS